MSLTVRLNESQSHGLAKTLFDWTKLSLAGVIIAPLAAGKLDVGLFITGSLSIAIFMSCAIILLNDKKRRRL